MLIQQDCSTKEISYLWMKHMGTDEKQFLLHTCFILVFVLHTMGSSEVLSQHNNKLEVPRIHDNFENSLSGISKALQEYSDKHNLATIN